MQQRRFRPGDVLDDYCPRERRITDHAIVAMIDDHIKQTRCVVCDAEHQYKEGKVPPQRRKKPQAALFSQVLDGLQGPQPAARLTLHADADLEPDPDLMPEDPETRVAPPLIVQGHTSGNGDGPGDAEAPVSLSRRGDDAISPPQLPAELPPAAAAQASPRPGQEEGLPVRDEGPVRRSLIRATLPRPEGQPAATRAMPEFTIRQPNTGRGGHRPGGRRRGGHQHHGQGGQGPTRFGRGGHGQGQRQHGGRSHGPTGGRSRRGGTKR